MLARRELLRAGGLWLAGLVLAPVRPTAGDFAIEILMRSDPAGGRVGFDPVGLLLRPGQTVRWVNAGENVHTSTAYHPANANHPLRIPAGAKPWDSGYLLHPGDRFELTLSVPGVYDYYCIPHEQAGMVGRLVVQGEPPASGTPTEPYPQVPENPVPAAALRILPTVMEILRRKNIPGIAS